MKALTLWQPWASLVARGEKRYETRSWMTTYRGPIAIHAALNSDMSMELYRTNSFYRKVFEAWGMTADDVRKGMPMGVVVAIADLVAVEKTEALLYSSGGLGVSQKEENFGDWSLGRYAWQMENVRRLEPPIGAFGRQGLWEWRLSVDEALRMGSLGKG